MRDRNRTKTQRISKRAKPARQITELHTSKARRTGAKEAAQESEYWKKAIIDSIPGVVWLKDKEYRFVAVNERLCEALGMRAEDLIGKTDFDVWPRDLAEQLRAHDEEVMKTGKPKRVEKQWGPVGGDRIWIETIKTPIFDEKGEVIATSGIAHDITERKLAGKALVASEAKYKSLFDNSIHGIGLSKGNRVFSANKAILDIFGFDCLEEFTKIPLLNHVAPESREMIRERMKKREKGEPITPTFEYKIIRKDGKIRVLEAASGEISIEGEKYTQSTFRDITERKRAEEKLRLLSSAVEQSSEGVGVANMEGNLMYVNSAFADMHGYTEEELAGKQLSIFHAPEQMLSVEASIRQVKETGQFSGELERVRRDGEVFATWMNNSLLQDDAGKPIGMIGTVLDITERKRAEEALRESEEQYRAIFEQAADSIVLVDGKSGALVEFNEKACENLGYTREEFQKLKIPDFEIIESAEQVSGHIEKIIREGSDTFETKQRTKDGRIRDILISSKAVSVHGGDFVQSIWRDVTERKQVENQRQRLTEVLREKNRELEQIIRVATHDMRTPMVNILGFGRILASSCTQIQALIEGQKISDELKKQLNEIIGVDIPEAVGIMNLGVSKMNSLLDGLLRLAKLGYSATGIIKLDMNTKIESILDTMKFQIEQSGAEIKVDKPLPSCLGDEAQINQVFSNLLGNALKYLDPSRPGSVRISGQVQQNYSVYCVQDNGIGIEADNIEDIFKMFYRVRPADDAGEGLGLTIVRRIVNRHNGEVWAESEVGKGSKFFVKLPRR